MLSLALATLDSAMAHFAVVLRDRAKSNYVNTTDGILNDNFRKLQKDVLACNICMMVAATAFAIFGAVIAVHPRGPQKYTENLIYPILQTIVSLIALVTGGYVADHVHGFQTSFKKFGANDSIPYYGVMYYGGVTQAAYGSLFFFLAISLAVVSSRDHRHTSQHRVQNAAEEVTVADNSEQKYFQV